MTRLRVVLFVLLGALVLLLGLRAAARWRRVEQVSYLVAKSPLVPGQVVKADDLARVASAGGVLPPSAVADPATVVGRRIQRQRAAGEMLAPADFQEPRKWLVDQVPAGRVSLSLRAPQTAVPYRDLKYGDHLDIMVTRRDGSTVVAARDAIFIGYSAPPEPAANAERAAKSSVAAATRPPEAKPASTTVQLILGVHPEDVFPLSTGVSAAAIIVHGAKEAEKGTLLPIEPPAQAHTVEVVAGARREQVMVP